MKPLKCRKERREEQQEGRELKRQGLSKEEIHELKEAFGGGGQDNFRVDWKNHECTLGGEKVK